MRQIIRALTRVKALAYGFAANGKKQYKYHPKWNAARSPKEISENIHLAAVEASEALGNTPAICRDNSIHPLVFSVYENPGQFEKLVHDGSHDGGR